MVHIETNDAMLPKSLLLKMKSVLATALSSGTLLVSSGVSAGEKPGPEPVPPPKAPTRIAPLTAEQLKIFNENLPIYLTGDEQKSAAALTVLLALGGGSPPLIEVEMKKNNAADMRKLNNLHRQVKTIASGDPCPPCGLG